MKRIGYKHTVAASFTAFVVQAVVNNFAPLLFLTFQAQYGIELSKITVLITANFFIQIFVDLTAVLFVDRIGYRASTVLAHAMCATGLIFMTILPEILPSAFAGLLISVFCYAVGAGLLDITINPIVNSCPSTNSNQLLCLLHSFYCWGSVAAAGLVSLTVLPEILPSPFVGLLISVVLYAVGGGLLEVIVSPIVEACPTDNKEKMMSLLHSFYCWGSVAVVGISTLYFSIFTTANWKYLALIWAVVPAVNALNFVRVPIAPLIEEGETGLSFKQLLGNRMFWIFMLLILCSGASEQAVSQWASTFAEKGLGVSKTVGDLAGPMLFSVLMGVSRVIYGKFGDKIDLDGMMIFSGALCMASYLLIALSSSAVLGLVGVAMCGFSVGIMWPGTFSKASAGIKGGGTAMFALLALGGDLGCSSGPTFAGMMASAFGDDLKKGILCAIFFPALLTVLTIFTKRRKAKI